MTQDQKKANTKNSPVTVTMKPFGMKGTGSYSPPPEKPTNEDKGDNDGR